MVAFKQINLGGYLQHFLGLLYNNGLRLIIDIHFYANFYANFSPLFQ